MPRAADSTLELELILRQQAPQPATTTSLQLCFILIYKFNNAEHQRIINRRIEASTHRRINASTH